MKLLKRRIKDRKLLHLIWKYLRAGVMEQKLFKDTKRGVPQGGIISPLLANVYLHELDTYMERYTALTRYEKQKRRKQGHGNYAYVRYADDFVVLCSGTKRDTEALRQELYEFLRDTLRLTLSLEKTKVTHLNEGFDFLGFRIQRCRGHRGMSRKILIPKKAVDKLRAKIAAATDAGTHKDSVDTKFIALSRIISGWCQYYQYTSKASMTFTKLHHQVFWRVAHWLGRKFEMSTPAVLRKFWDGSTFRTKEQRLTMPGTFTTQRYKERIPKPNPYTTQACIRREELPRETRWTGHEPRQGMEDLRAVVLARDNHTCRQCGTSVTAHTAHVDHIRPVRRFKRPVDAHALDNLQTLCIPCHQKKTEADRQTESRVR